VRALEVYYCGGVPISQRQKNAVGLWTKLPIKIFGLMVERGDLYKRIEARTEAMFKAGAVEEVQGLLKMPLSHTAQKIIGIKEIKSYLDGDLTLDQAKALIKKNTRNYAKRQMTWFKKDKRVEWVSGVAT